LKVVLQRVREASVAVGGQEIARIGRGLLVLAAIEKGDTGEATGKMALKISKLRIFEDDQGKMNRSVQDVGGEVLVVSQFTLAADLEKGTRPGFDSAEDPQKAGRFMEDFGERLRRCGLKVAEGRFGARMEVMLLNDGPVTFVLSEPSG